MSLTKLYFSSVLVVFFVLLEIFCFLIKSESSHNGSKIRPGPFPFIPLATPRGLNIYPTPEVHFAVPLC